MKVKDIIHIQDLENEGSVHKAIELAKSTYLPYPERIPKPILSDNKSLAAAKEYFEKMQTYELAKHNYTASINEVKEYNSQVDEIIIAFIKDQSGLLNIPEQYQTKVYERAWSEGHSNGHYEVYTNLCNLVDIFA